jgi:hypothetical protein
VVRRVGGRPVYLTEAAVPVFDGERRRAADERLWASERRRWLRLARTVKAPVERRERIERAALSADAVHAARTLYLTAADREVRTARRARRWNEVAAIRREQAAVLFKESGSTAPPPEDVVLLHQEAASAALRALPGIARQAELVGGTCCAACRADDGKTFRIADELRVPRLPHAACPRGLCGCDWWVATEAPRRRRRATSGHALAAVTPTAGQGAEPADSADSADIAGDGAEPDMSADTADADAEPDMSAEAADADATDVPAGPPDDAPGSEDTAAV